MIDLVITANARSPFNRYALPRAAHSAKQHNDHCPDKDEITVYVDVREGVISRVTFQGHGCDLCIASASIMAKLFEVARTRDEARLMTRNFEDLLAGNPGIDDVGELRVFYGTHTSRIPCVSLPWRALGAALNRRGL